MQNPLPAMKKGSRIILNEGVLPEPLTLERGEERSTWIMDMEMITTFNARKRPLEDSKKLCRDVHPGLKLRHGLKPAASIMSIMKLVLEE
ncbi:putative O-methyltransferase [Aspergillus flavus]|nr:putative O-methyltransferase [Aspergillus flavus]